MERTAAGGGPPDPRSTRTGWLMVVAVAGVEALLAAAGAVAAVLSGVQDGSLVLGAAVGGVAGGIAYLMAEVARGFAAGRRWPTGVFVTVQLLAALVAVSLGGRALLTVVSNPGIAVVTLVALALAVAGLVGVALLARERPAGATGGDEPPVF